MRNFILFFEEKEGTSPLVRLLANFNQISVIHQVNNSGWEPFDRHSCGLMSIRNLKQCLELIFDKEPLHMECLNQIYTRTATKPLEAFNKNGAVGFKMRFVPPKIDLPIVGNFSVWCKFARYIYLKYQTSRGTFKKMMFDLLKRHNLVAFLAVRQDVLRWALSKYHGDGTTMYGHLQFKIASGQVNKKDIPKIEVDCNRLEKLILKCEKSHKKKQALKEDFEQAGINTYPVLYEDFLKDKLQCFMQIFKQLEMPVSKQEITDALNKGAYFKKVHSDDISEFVINYQEVLDRFEGRYVAWR